MCFRCSKEASHCYPQHMVWFEYLMFDYAFLSKLRSEIVWHRFFAVLLSYVFLGPTLLWESYSCIPPLISPAGSVALRASDKAMISWEKSRNWETCHQTKTIWHVWTALHELIWKWQYFHYNIWEWLFQLARNSWKNYKAWLHTMHLEN